MAWKTKRGRIWWVGWTVDGIQYSGSTGETDEIQAELKRLEIEFLALAKKAGRLNEYYYLTRQAPGNVCFAPSCDNSEIPPPREQDFARWGALEGQLGAFSPRLLDLRKQGFPEYLDGSGVYIWFGVDPSGALIERKEFVYVGETSALAKRQNQERQDWILLGRNHLLWFNAEEQDRKRLETSLIQCLPCSNRAQNRPNRPKSWDLLKRQIQRTGRLC